MAGARRGQPRFRSSLSAKHHIITDARWEYVMLLVVQRADGSAWKFGCDVMHNGMQRSGRVGGPTSGRNSDTDLCQSSQAAVVSA